MIANESWWSVYYECPRCWAGGSERVPHDATVADMPQRNPCPCGGERTRRQESIYTEISSLNGEEWFRMWRAVKDAGDDAEADGFVIEAVRRGLA